jgi:hypothetical protein
MRHLPVQIPRNRGHPFNIVYLRLMAQSSTGLQELGSISFHLHDLVKGCPHSGEYSIFGEYAEVANVNLDITFNYGLFGYGHSLMIATEDGRYESHEYSLLPRIAPPEEDGLEFEIQAVPHPNFIPFDQKIYLSHGKDIQHVLESLSDQIYQPNNILAGDHINKMKSDVY